ncbi:MULTISPECIES: STAS domain-containing protein [unclassified Peribacillus]|uniref:STAS domain-containing protein n=1 Tax=unclassified Peribacillus TaxID=2675266 RepID=UPI0019120DBF|nr:MULTISPECIES: STAS domain-containing protein [unclassified Peribacillus]MBK5444198.1 STAS domain-containing protein [Peribacillus sp. TH24]MBK5461097.1 STAS domain-containing protein [Peribacillus sp. TH27]
MDIKDELLYRYILDHSSTITENWLALREKQDGSIYSVDTHEEVEEILRKQNTLTIKTVTSVLLEDKTVFVETMEQWATLVAKSRVESDTPIYEVLEALNKVRRTYWDFIAGYMLQVDAGISKGTIIRWSRLINSAFDQLNHEFTEQYYLLTKERLLAQQELINELGAPVIPIVDAIAVLPLIGEIDTFRAKGILNTTPGKCISKNVSHLFIDLSGVTLLDTMVAHQIYQLISTLNLLGIQSTISGIRPEVAQMSIQLGLDFSHVSTHSTLKQALSKQGIKLYERK